MIKVVSPPPAHNRIFCLRALLRLPDWILALQPERRPPGGRRLPAAGGRRRGGVRLRLRPLLRRPPHGTALPLLRRARLERAQEDGGEEEVRDLTNEPFNFCDKM